MVIGYQNNTLPGFDSLQSTFMKLILTRHGEAENGTVDHLRNLTETGIKDIRNQGNLLIHTGWKFSHILTSPVTRANQTAMLFQETLSSRFPNLEVEEEANLAPGVNLDSFDDVISRFSVHDVVLMAFHMPDVARIASYITGMSETHFYFTPGAMLALNLPLPVYQSRGMLIWMYQPEYLRNIYD